MADAAADDAARAVMAWHGGLHAVHCRDDRCNGGATCDCPCHTVSMQIRAAQEYIRRTYGHLADQPRLGWRADYTVAQRAHKRKRRAMLVRLYARVRP